MSIFYSFPINIKRIVSCTISKFCSIVNISTVKFIALKIFHFKPQSPTLRSWNFPFRMRKGQSTHDTRPRFDRFKMIGVTYIPVIKHTVTNTLLFFFHMRNNCLHVRCRVPKICQSVPNDCCTIRQKDVAIFVVFYLCHWAKLTNWKRVSRAF